MAAKLQRTSKGQVSYHAGLSAEEAVARAYQLTGYEIAERRWHGAGGEIDLILQNDDAVVFVEVKKSASFADAALRVSPRQMQRIYSSAEEYLGTRPLGALTEARFDVALVDGQGRIHIIENAFGGT